MEMVELEVCKCPFCGELPALGKACEGVCLYCDCRDVYSEYGDNLEEVIESWNSVCSKNAGGGGC